MSILHVPFYPSDWLAGTRGLSDAETGVYITLISRMYEMAGPIERDDKRLARLCGCKSKPSFVRALDYLISEGKIVVIDGELFNERVKKEIKNTTERSDKAKAAAQSRWDRKSNKNNVRDDASASSEHMPQKCQLEPELDIREEPKGSLSSGDDFPVPDISAETECDCTPPVPKPIDEVAEAVAAYTDAAEQSGWPRVSILSPARRSALKARLRECGGLEGWAVALAKAQASSHCCGDNDRGWTASFDFLTKQSSFAKLMEGNYDNRTPKPRPNAPQSGGPSSGTSMASIAARRAFERQAGG